MPPANLPSHLSYKSAIVLLLPSNIASPVQKLRAIHDRNYDRWPPHINLLYPFIAMPSERMKLVNISRRICTALRAAVEKDASTVSLSAFSLSLDTISHFQHSENSSTIWLSTNHEGQLATLKRLQQALQEEFKECDADSRPYVPHLSIGQARSKKSAENLRGEVADVMMEFCTGDGNTDHIDGGAHGVYKSTEAAPTMPHRPWALRWDVDRVCVIERKGFSGPFQVVGEALLADAIPQ